MFGIGIPELITLIALLLLHFLPTIIALSRDHSNTVMIILINIFLGWTGLGWFTCLIWSFIDTKDEDKAKRSEKRLI